MQTPFGELPDRLARDMSMAERYDWLRARISRRSFLRGAVGGAAAVAAGPIFWKRPGLASVSPAGIHLAYGADPMTQMAISWSTAGGVQNATAEIGLDTTYGASLTVEQRHVSEYPATVYHHAVASGLQPSKAYHYRLSHADGPAVTGTFQTAPATPGPFTFTAFGDQGASAAAIANTALLNTLKPAFHFHVGDLSYATRLGGADRVEDGYTRPVTADDLITDTPNQATWDQWFAVIKPQASVAPWMPAVGNHEMETGYGWLGYDGYHARFTLPRPTTYYSFRYANVAVIALDGNDASYQLQNNRGYTLQGPDPGGQDGWLAATLQAIRSDPTIDFIVAGFHYCAYCTNLVHGSDQGVRDRWQEYFDLYEVDLVINGHNHCYERTHPLREGKVVGDPVSPDTVISSKRGEIEGYPSAPSTVIDSKLGTTYVTAGGGGNSPYPVSLYPAASVNREEGVRAPESGLWSAIRYNNNSLIAVDVTPRKNGVASMTIRALRPGPDSSPIEIENVTLFRTAPPGWPSG